MRDRWWSPTITQQRKFCISSIARDSHQLQQDLLTSENDLKVILQFGIIGGFKNTTVRGAANTVTLGTNMEQGVKFSPGHSFTAEQFSNQVELIGHNPSRSRLPAWDPDFALLRGRIGQRNRWRKELATVS